MKTSDPPPRPGLHLVGGAPPGGLQSETAFDRLRDEIRQGRLAPGSRLTETEIAQRLNISRTPVREAIRRLEAEGLVQHLPRAGAVVRQLDHAEVMELYEMRAVLDGTAARLAARTATGGELDELAAINDTMAQAAAPTDLARANALFHTLLRDAARNRFLVGSMRSLDAVLLLLGPSAMHLPDRAREAVGEHRQVLAALAARDGAAAEAAMRRHLERAQRIRLQMLRQRRDAGQP
jgi:DNA-binding GntR family transcriptional regulator